MKEKVIFIHKNLESKELEELLAEGWTTKSVTAQNVATGARSFLYGSFLIILHKKINEDE